jgi:hypothetical protein
MSYTKPVPHIEDYPDQYWMSSVERRTIQSGGSTIAFVEGVNHSWPSRRLKSTNVFDGRGRCSVVHEWPGSITKFGWETFDPMI